jgi:hypothetical protein
MKLHAFHTLEQPPLCGQKDRHGKRYLLIDHTTRDHYRVTCEKCFGLLSTAITKPEHSSSADCWCEPTIEFKDPATGAAVYVHKDIQ